MTSEHEEIKYLVGIIFSALSLASIFALYIVYWIKSCSYENAFFRMVVHMEIPNAIYAITGFVIFPESLGTYYCTISGAVRQYCLISTSVWTLVIAIHIKTSIADHEIRPFSQKYLIMGYGLAIPFAVVPAILNIYTLTPMYCGLPLTDIVSYILVHYVPILTVLVGTCYCYFSVILYLYKTVSKEAAKEFYPLFVYPVLIVACNIGNFIYLVLELTGSSAPDATSVMFVVWTGILQAQGLLDVGVYSMNYAIREEIAMKFCPSRRSDIDADFDVAFKSRMGTVDINLHTLPDQRSATVHESDETRGVKSVSFFEIEHDRKMSSFTV